MARLWNFKVISVCVGGCGGFGMRVLVVVCFAVALGEVAHAQQHADVRGYGASSCAQYANMYRMRPDEADKMFLGWAMGYISGVNERTDDGYFDLGAKEPDEMKRFLRHYCDVHPLANYHDGVEELMKSLPFMERQK